MVRTLYLTMSFVRLADSTCLVIIAMNDSFARFTEVEPYGHRDGKQTQIMKSVDLAQPTAKDGQTLLRQYDIATNQGKPSTLASLMPSPITAKLNSLSTFMPFSWGAPARPAPAAEPSTNKHLPQGQHPQAKSYVFVTRQQQLEKLKKRMEVQGRRQMNTSAFYHCGDCADFVVVL